MELDPGLSPENRPHHQQLYHLLFELMPGSVVLMDARGFVLDANPAFCRQIGFSREELLGTHVSRFSQDSIETIERTRDVGASGDQRAEGRQRAALRIARDGDHFARRLPRHSGARQRRHRSLARAADGVKALAELRRHQPQVKAVLTSGYDVEGSNLQYLLEGFAAFIRKPFQLEALITVARRMCAKESI